MKKALFWTMGISGLGYEGSEGHLGTISEGHLRVISEVNLRVK